MEYTEGNKLDFTKYEQLLKERAAQFNERTQGKRIEHSFQELGIEMQRYFGRNIWHLFYKYKEQDLREAFAICQRNEKKSVGYLLGIIRHKYNGF